MKRVYEKLAVVHTAEMGSGGQQIAVERFKDNPR